jgi:serine/threonine protein kinase
MIDQHTTFIQAILLKSLKFVAWRDPGCTCSNPHKLNIMSSVLRTRWAQARALFEAALEKSAAVRAVWLATQANDDPDLLEAVQRMLNDIDTSDDEDNSREDSRYLGRYRVLRELGRGGMSVVYLAEQDAPRRTVALKQLNRVSAEHTARLQREAELLARLSHPGIAQVFELALDAQGTPFLVMEYIDGPTLREHCQHLNREARLALLVQIADAVEHAHARGVLHRDLKPSNVLVDANGQPKLLDFGIGARLDVVSTLTETGGLLGTPAYMSPEQASGKAIDARSDVYALGVMGYELLVDRLPLPVSGLTPLDALRVVSLDTPQPLARIDRRLRGDLSTVFATALSKEPSLRYASAGAFADDLRCALNHEPIRARAVPRWRRLQLYAKREPEVFAALSVAILALLLGSGFALNFARLAEQQQNRAQDALQQAEQTLLAFSRVLSNGNPALSGEPDVRFRQVLIAANKSLSDVAPAAQLPVRYQIALAQRQIGDFAAAARSFEYTAKLATEQNQPELADQAVLRALMARTHLDDFSSLATIAEQRLSSGPISPLIEAGLRLLVLERDAIWGAEKRAMAQFWNAQGALMRAEAESAARVPPQRFAPALTDPSLHPEIAIRIKLRELEFVVSAQPGALTPEQYLASMRVLERTRGAQLASYEFERVMLETYLDALPDLMALRDGWRDRLIAQMESERERLGATHPVVQARLLAAVELMEAFANIDPRIGNLWRTTQQALPANTRQRLRWLVGWITQLRASESSALIQELDDLSRAVCANADALDVDCFWARLASVQLLQNAGRIDQASSAIEALGRDLAQIPYGSQLFIAHATQAFAQQRIHEYEKAATHAELAIDSLLRNEELFESRRDIYVLQTSWAFRPLRCDRVLALVAPREQRLSTYPQVAGDSLARLLSTCEVRQGMDLEPALARLAPWWQQAQEPGADPWLQMEIINAHLEIYEVLKDQAGFERWAQELHAWQQRGSVLPVELLRRFPWLRRALTLPKP